MPSSSESEAEIEHQPELSKSEIFKRKDKITTHENINKNEFSQKYGFEISFKYRYNTISRLETSKNIKIIDLL